MSSKSERVHKYLSEDLTIRASSVIATHVVEEMRALQSTTPVPTVAVGRAMVGALLMASHLKGSQELSLYFRGNGPLSTIFAEASHEGRVRAYTSNPQFELEQKGEKILVGPAIGIGLLTVTHHLPKQQVPHRGTVIIRTGEIGDDIAFYLEQSHQINSVVALGVHLDDYGRVKAAGGILIELMPGHSEEAVAKIEARVQAAAPVSKRILEGATPEELVKDYLADFNLTELSHNYELNYQCRCDVERVKRSVALLGVEEIDRILEENKPELEVTCEFCGKRYALSRADLEEIRTTAYRGSLN